MTTTQPPACGKISEIRARDLCGMGTPSNQSAHDRRTLLRYIDELLSHRHPAPVADERAELTMPSPIPAEVQIAAALSQAEKALIVLFTMLKKAAPQGAVVADEILGSVKEAQKLFSTLVIERTSAALSAQPSGALEREKCDACRGVGTVLASGHWPHDVQARCEACDGTGQQPAHPPERAPGGDAFAWAERQRYDAMMDAPGSELHRRWEAICAVVNTPPPSSSPSATTDATLRAALDDPCVWTEIEDDSGIYNTCKEGWEFHLDEGLELYPHCMWCGKRVEAALAGNEGEKL